MELWGQRNVDFYFLHVNTLSYLSLHLSHTYTFMQFLHYIYFIHNVHCVAFPTPNNINKSYSCKSPIHCWDIKPVSHSTNRNTGH